MLRFAEIIYEFPCEDANDWPQASRLPRPEKCVGGLLPQETDSVRIVKAFATGSECVGRPWKTKASVENEDFGGHFRWYSKDGEASKESLQFQKASRPRMHRSYNAPFLQ